MFKSIKTIMTAIICCSVIMSFSGCAVLGSDIREFQVPPKLTTEQQGIYDGLARTVGNNFTLKYPLSGNYRSAFITKNLSDDNTENAIAIYTPSAGTDGPHVAILQKNNDVWNVTAQITSQGNEIDSIDFADFDGDSNTDIVIGWRSFNSTDLTLMVYLKSSQGYNAINLNTFTKMKILDLTGDSKDDIVVFTLNNDPTKAKARLISYRSGKLEEVSSCPMDSTVQSYDKIYVTSIAKNKALLIDGYKGKDKMITEIVYFSFGKLISPLYSPKTQTVTSTLRFYPIKCMDIDNTGIYQIPLPVELPTDSEVDNISHKWLVQWSTMIDDSNEDKLSTVINEKQNYYFKYPKKWGKLVSYTSESQDSIWTFKLWDSDNSTFGESLFSITVFKSDTFNNLVDKNDYNVVYQNNTTIYAAKIFNETKDYDMNLSFDEIKANFGYLN